MEQYLQLMDRDLGHRLDPETVLALGERAAKMHVEGGTPLTEAVLTIVRGKALNPAHVARITETANQRAYLLLYDQASGPTRSVEFDGGPAEIFDIMKKIFGASGSKVEPEKEIAMEPKAALDYLLAPMGEAPPMRKAASVRDGEVLADHMSLAEQARFMGQAYNTPTGRVHLYEKVKDAAEKKAQDVAGLTARLRESGEKLVKMASEALAGGHTPPQIARVMFEGYGNPAQMSEASKEKQAAWQAVVFTMAKLGRDLDLRRIPWGLEPTEGHQLTVETQKFAKLAKTLWEATRTSNELRKTAEDIRKRLGG